MIAEGAKAHQFKGKLSRSGFKIKAQHKEDTKNSKRKIGTKDPDGKMRVLEQSMPLTGSNIDLIIP